MATSTDELTATGLTSTEASRLLEDHGPNEVTVRRPVPLLTRVGTQLRDPLIVVLLAAVVLTVLTGDYPDAIIIGFVVVANTSVGVAQELRAQSAVAALSALAAPTARVHRDGLVRTVPAVDLVPGDVVDLTQGDIVPADALLVESAALLVDEAALTGESVPVEKSAGSAPGSAVSAGTVVVRGRALARITATGATSATGRIANMLDTGPDRTPLQRRLAGLGRVLAGVAGGLCVVVAALGLWRGQPLELMVVTAISLVVAAVPESLPAVVTLSLALGARRMAARGAIVRRLAAVETLGSVTVVATDKTGTLTEGQMVVERLWTPSGEARTTGLGYGPDGEVVPESGTGEFADLLAATALCNDAAVEPPTEEAPRWTAIGDPTEAALLTAASKTGPDDVPALDSRGAYRVTEAPFDSLRRRMSTLHRLPDGRYLLTCKGAPEVLLTADRLADPTGATSPALARAAAFADAGYRVLAVARKVLAAAPPDLTDLAAEETGLELLGLVAISDPPRPAAADAIAACRAAGISTVLITGDHAATASALAGRLGLLAPGEAVVTGNQLSPGAHGPGLTPVGVHVFARTTPEQKLDIIQALRDDGQVVAMIGDGVNDAPALRRADIGVAMGGRGTEVARQAADLVLADDDLATVTSAVEEGRRVYANVRRFLLYALAGGTAEIVVMLVGPLLGMALPLLPAQILWVNLVTHGLPGVALGAEPVAEGTMTRAPRPPDQSVLGAGLWLRILQLATVVAGTTLAVGWWAATHDMPWQSMLFVTLGATQLGTALGVRARPGTLTNPALLWATAAAFGLQVIAVYLPWLQALLGTTALSAGQLAAVSATAVVGFVAARLQTWRAA